MSNDQGARSSRSERHVLFELSTDDTAETVQLIARIEQMLDANVDVESIADFIDRIRRRGDAEQGSNLDRFLLTRIAGFGGAKKKLETVLRELQESLEALLRPPFFPARYLGSVTTQAGEFAKVAQDGAHRVIAFAEDIEADDLSPGDEVLLCHERNAVISKVSHFGPETGETATLVRYTGDGRLVLSDRDSDVIVASSGRIAQESLKPGDRILWDRKALIALSRVESADEQGYEDVDDSLPSQLGGIDQIRDSVIARFVYGIAFPDLAREYQVHNNGTRRLLLHGAPGTGKTTLMRIVAAKISSETGQKCRVITIKGAELHSPFVGETEQNIRRCFATLNDYEGPGIVFFDEIDAIGRARGHASGSGYHDDRFLGTLLAELEGMSRSSVAVIAATNRADTLDSALRSRFSFEFRIPLPNRKAASEIFRIHMPTGVPYQPNSGEAPKTREAIIDVAISRLYDPNCDNGIASLQFRDGKRREVVAREMVSGRLIEQICGAARDAAFKRRCGGGAAGVSVEDMQFAVAEAIGRLRETLSPGNARNFLADLPQDLDVVSVDSVQAHIEAARYVR